MAVSKTGEGKEAITHYEVAERFSYFTRLCIRLETAAPTDPRAHEPQSLSAGGRPSLWRRW